MRATGRLLALLPLVLVGCSPTGSAGDWLHGRGSGPLAPDVDAVRAYRPLDQIEPRPVQPASPKSIDPLSDRASRKIARSQKLIGETRYTEAAIELERALRYDPNHPDIHRTLATLHWEAGNLVRTRTHAARALKIRPDDAVAQYLLARCHRLAGDPTSAIQGYRTALLCRDADTDFEIAALCHYHLAEVLAVEGYLEASLAQYAAFAGRAESLPTKVTRVELAALLESKAESVANAKATILEKLGRFAEAADELAPVASGSPHDVSLGRRFVRLLIRARRYSDALVAVRGLPLKSNDLLELLLEIHSATGHPERVVDDLRGRMVDRADDPELVLSLSSMLVRLERSESAGRELQSFLDRHPDADEVRSRLVDVLIARSSWDDALRAGAAGIERNPGQAAVFSDKIMSLSSNEEAVEALLGVPSTAARRAAAPSSFAAYLRGVLALEADRLEDAEQWLRASREGDSTFVPARVAQARVALRRYRYDEALRVAGRAAEDTPENARLERVLGEVYERLDDFDASERHFQAAIQLNRRDTQAMFALAEMYRHTGRRLQAQRELRVLLDKNPDHERARELLAYLYVDEGKLDVAVEQLEKLRKRAVSPLVKARCSAFLQHIDAEDPAGYRRLLFEAMEQYGADVDTWLAVAQSFERSREDKGRRDAFAAALAIDRDNEEAALGLIEMSRRLLAFEEAADLQAALLRKRPNRHGWRLGFSERRLGRLERFPGLIQLYWMIQDFDAALDLVKTALAQVELDDLWRQRYRSAMFATLRQAHRNQETLELAQQWHEREPDQDAYAMLLASEYVRQDQPLKAVAILEVVHEEKRGFTTLSSLLEALLAADLPSRASQYVLDWLDSDPLNDRALLTLSGVLAKAGKLDEALELIRDRLLHTERREHFQSRAIVWMERAEAYDRALDLIEHLTDEVVTLLHSGREPRIPESDLPLLDERRSHLPDEPFSAERLHDRLVTLRRSKAELLLSAEDYTFAERELASWLDTARAPEERFGYLLRLALCHRLRGDEERASEVQRRALALQPDHPSLNNDVAYGWIDQGTRLDEAEPMIRSSLGQAPFNGAYLDTYGWLMYKKGEFAEAKKWLARAKHIVEGEDPVVLSHLGDTLWRLGESEEAVLSWEAALEAAARRPEDRVMSEDEKQVGEAAPAKIAAARAGRPPAVAPSALPSKTMRDKPVTPNAR